MYDLEQHIVDQFEWSAETFGPGPSTSSIINHIKEELVEIEEEPSDLSEWIDVIILALDGASRCVKTYEVNLNPTTEEIAHAVVVCLANKHQINKKRQWTDWRTVDPDKAINHIKEGEEEVDSTL